MDLKIDGQILKSKSALKKYSRDRSAYEIKPKIVAVPRNEKDVVKIIDYARKNKIPVTARAAGSDISGAAIGRGIVLDFSKMNSIVSKKGNVVRVQPGVVYDDLNRKMKRHGLFLPYSPSSGSFCTIGGNVGTKASGLRGVKYGGVEFFVKSLKFVDANGRIIDTSEKIPEDFKRSISRLHSGLLKDRESLKILESKKKLKTSSGYNIKSLLSQKSYGKVLTHLILGSVGTVGLVTEVELELARRPERKLTGIAFTDSLENASEIVEKSLKLNPSALEIMESAAMKKNKHLSSEGKIVLVELDSHISKRGSKLKNIFLKHSTSFQIETNSSKQEKLWNVRKNMLIRTEKIRKGKAIPVVEDVSIPPKNLVEFVTQLKKVLAKHGTNSVVYGHAGEGNLHIRPLIPRDNWKKRITKLSWDVARLVFKYNGSMTGEHGSGRCRTPFMKKEWGPVLRHFKAIKKEFDPAGILNPDVVFSNNELTKDMKY